MIDLSGAMRKCWFYAVRKLSCCYGNGFVFMTYQTWQLKKVGCYQWWKIDRCYRKLYIFLGVARHFHSNHCVINIMHADRYVVMLTDMELWQKLRSYVICFIFNNCNNWATCVTFILHNPGDQQKFREPMSLRQCSHRFSLLLFY